VILEIITNARVIIPKIYFVKDMETPVTLLRMQPISYGG